ncbi:MAG: ABC transporter permease, partial [Phycisphaerae bacterium]|nr:ABC transporter permease [Phycisphaerae bacterium]
LVGLTQGTLREISDRMESVDAQLMVWPSSGQVVLSGGLPAEAVERKILAMAGVERAIPVLNWVIRMAGEQQNAFGIRPEDFKYFGKGRKLIDGRLLVGGDEMLIDSRLVKAGGYRVGQTVERGGTTLKIVGIVQEGVAGRVFIPYQTVCNINEGRQKRASFFYVRMDGPEHAEEIMEAIRRLGLKVFSIDQYYTHLATSLFRMNEVTTAVLLVAGFVCFLVILLTSYTIVIERTREIGILKALGASKGRIFGIILSESGVMCVAGILAGYGFTFSLRWLILEFKPLLTIAVPPERMLAAAGLGLAGAILGALYPAVRAARQDPIRSLRHE